MNSFVSRYGIQRRRQARLTDNSIWIAVLVLLGMLLPGAAAAAQRRRGTPPPPTPLPGQNVVQVVNSSSVTVLLAAFGPTVVEPREGTWVLPPNGTLTLDIPKEWQNTTASGSRGPRIWVRTGCRYDTTSGRAQCETGDCGGKYDCGKAGLAHADIELLGCQRSRRCQHYDEHRAYQYSPIPIQREESVFAARCLLVPVLSGL
jgi:hypothetical protein